MGGPDYAFSLPSIEDHLPLDCRVYLPEALHSNTADGHIVSEGAVIAHPYAPLGGCFEDSVVIALKETFLDAGFFVCTFNFRGAPDSQGRTSWSGKAEQNDFISCIGFMIHYLSNIKRVEGSGTVQTIPQEQNQRTTDPTSPKHGGREPVNRLILAGYSYGSLILARLPPTSVIESMFEQAEMGTAPAEIILRAKTLAEKSHHRWRNTRDLDSPRGRRSTFGGAVDNSESPDKRHGSSPVVVGGEETMTSEIRRSRESHRSIGLVRKSVEAPQRIKEHIRRHSYGHRKTDYGSAYDPDISPPLRNGITRIGVQYLLISPVLVPFTHILLPPGPPSLISGFGRQVTDTSSAGKQFHGHPTLAVFGTADIFSSNRRLKEWAERNASESQSVFEWEQVEGAGHFWQEEIAMETLKRRVVNWVIRHRQD